MCGTSECAGKSILKISWHTYLIVMKLVLKDHFKFTTEHASDKKIRKSDNTPCLKKTVQTYFLSELCQINFDRLRKFLAQR